MSPEVLGKARLIIALTGAQGVGKSTLVSALEKRLGQSSRVPCTVHKGLGQEVAATGVPIGEHANANTILAFARLHVRRERRIVGGIHILDRCLVDLLAYVRCVCNDQTVLIGLIEELTHFSLSRVDLVVHVPLISSLSESTSPHESTQFRRQIDKLIGDTLRGLSVKHVVVDGETEQRVNEVLAVLRNVLADGQLLSNSPASSRTIFETPQRG
jgi:predicted ATPase